MNLRGTAAGIRRPRELRDRLRRHREQSVTFITWLPSLSRGLARYSARAQYKYDDDVSFPVVIDRPVSLRRGEHPNDRKSSDHQRLERRFVGNRLARGMTIARTTQLHPRLATRGRHRAAPAQRPQRLTGFRRALQLPQTISSG